MRRAMSFICRRLPGNRGAAAAVVCRRIRRPASMLLARLQSCETPPPRRRSTIGALATRPHSRTSRHRHRPQGQGRRQAYRETQSSPREEGKLDLTIPKRGGEFGGHLSPARKRRAADRIHALDSHQRHHILLIRQHRPARRTRREADTNLRVVLSNNPSKNIEKVDLDPKKRFRHRSFLAVDVKHVPWIWQLRHHLRAGPV
ncbi:hypothetical protein EV665_1192 [Shinella granuli]|uniref:Uncharacterized protein n=1 Tax=Shinella granuli TaxID=323621 RepID=A0A4R2CDD9_SHIGR|nr:hypothetical protein EV665_1192 [Shinella granuli]